MRLNLGSGAHILKGYANIDAGNGDAVYPLKDIDDGSCEEIRASHVLEHFSHRDSSAIIKHWADKLAPGGCLKIAVPNFEWIARNYLDGVPVNIQGYTMGGHNDEYDWHGATFDRETLEELFYAAGLERIGGWQSELDDCANLPVSLNLLAFKPSTPDKKLQGVVAMLSAPRFGPILHTRCAFSAMGRVGIPYRIYQGCFWHQIISELMEEALAEKETEYILTVDFDSVFTGVDVMELYRLIRSYDVDAICPLQSKRGGANHALFNVTKNPDGSTRTMVSAAEFDRNVTKIRTGHFGLTMFKAEALRKFPRPWMCPKPNAEGRWTDGHVDADMDFWHNWNRHGFRLGLANRVVIGHMEELVSWPGKDFKTVHQSVQQFEANGVPAEVRRESA